MNKRRQVPEQSWTFVYKTTGEIDSGILPKLGESNDFAVWDGRKGHSLWVSRRFKLLSSERYCRGIGPSGLIGRMKSILKWSSKNSIVRGYLPPNTTPEQMLEIWNSQKNLCIACGSPIELLEASFDHDHISGIPRGFIHKNCNTAEGMLARMTDTEFDLFISFVKKIRG